jgi:hypothetical protein
MIEIDWYGVSQVNRALIDRAQRIEQGVLPRDETALAAGREAARRQALYKQAERMRAGLVALDPAVVAEAQALAEQQSTACEAARLAKRGTP